jgi:choline kinase
VALDIIIPAAGIGTRIKNKCKSLIEINGESLINRQIRLLKDFYEKPRIILVLGYQAEEIQNQLVDDVEIAHNYAYEHNNVACSICVGLRRSKKKCLIVYGDLVFDKRMLESVPISSFSCLLFHKSESRINEVGINSVDGKVSRLGYGLDNQWAQVAFLNKQEKAICLELLRTPYRRNYFGYELINEVVDMGGPSASH